MKIKYEYSGNMTLRVICSALFVFGSACSSVTAQFEDPFSVSADLRNDATDAVLTVSLIVPNGYHLYADQVHVEPVDDSVKLAPYDIPQPVRKYDALAGAEMAVYDSDAVFKYLVDGAGANNLTINVRYQGCSPTMCFFPVSTNINFKLTTAEEALSDADLTGAGRQLDNDWQILADRFTVLGRESGYLRVKKFLTVLDEMAAGDVGRVGLLAGVQDRSVLLTLLLIVVGGLALNMTPCVLPMIPINLAIIGAGTQVMRKADSGMPSNILRWRGFWLGAAYGAGIAFAYGVLGLVVVLTGSRFGVLNSSPVFNIGIALLFLFLALAMFGVINIDFSKFIGGGAGGAGKKRGYTPAFTAGIVSALLAGACVAPVVISVLLFSADLYQAGNFWGLFLPFLLGIGMALPWPFAGAGLSLLPKPGRWMEYVKYAFGVLIAGLALYYGYEGYRLLSDITLADSVSVEESISEKNDWYVSLSGGLEAALREGKPVFIDFWASWCKSCIVMDRTTFRDAEVKERLSQYVKIQYKAEDMTDPEVKAVLDYFDVMGLPTYVMLVPGR